MRGDLQEGHFYASRCHLSLCSSTKMPILCSGSPKTGGPDPKQAQKPRFCARKAGKWGFQTPKAHKNGDFVLGLEAGVDYFTREEPFDVVDDAVWR